MGEEKLPKATSLGSAVSAGARLSLSTVGVGSTQWACALECIRPTSRELQMGVKLPKATSLGSAVSAGALHTQMQHGPGLCHSMRRSSRLQPGYQTAYEICSFVPTLPLEPAAACACQGDCIIHINMMIHHACYHMQA